MQFLRNKGTVLPSALWVATEAEGWGGGCLGLWIHIAHKAQGVKEYVGFPTCSPKNPRIPKDEVSAPPSPMQVRTPAQLLYCNSLFQSQPPLRPKVPEATGQVRAMFPSSPLQPSGNLPTVTTPRGKLGPDALRRGCTADLPASSG